MAISFSGLASGLDTSSWVEALVSVKQQKVSTLQTDVTKYQTIKSTLTNTRSVFSSLRSAIEKLTDAKFGGAMDLFTKNMAESSNTDIFTATATSDARRQNYDIYVKQLATYTKAMSKETASAVADDSTVLSNLGISEGSFTAYVNGEKKTINIGEGDTIGELKSRLAEAGIKAEVNDDGVLTLSAQDGVSSVDFGATTDTSNFYSLVGLEKGEDGKYNSTNSLYKATVASKLTSEESGFKTRITEGTFTIGNATFTIDENTTLSSLISKINNSDEAQAYAYWDDTTGKLSITSTKEGASYINIEAGTSNFTDVMGLTVSEWDENGSLISSKMHTDAQTLGQNAIFSINGTTMTSTSNVVTSDISKIEGVTLTLKRANTEEDKDVTLKVSQDTKELKDALSAFVNAYNEVMTTVDNVTASGADLHGESSLTSLKNTLRNYANGSNKNDGIYKLLSDIGISTNSANGSDLTTDTNSLHLDEDKLLKALEENPESVKSILTGSSGVLSMMENAVEQSLSSVTGYFDIKTSTLDKNIQNINDKIKKQNTSIENYRKSLESKFYKMELMIAQMQQNYSSFLS